MGGVPSRPVTHGVCTHQFFVDLAFYFIKSHMDRLNFKWQDCPNYPPVPENPDKCCLAMTKLAQKFEDQNKSETSSLMWEFPLTTQTGYASFMVSVFVFSEHVIVCYF